jgi:mannose-6-phosphate isomerase-like protein (cupin superfamily)
VSDYTVVNLMDLEDSVGDALPGVEGRFGRKALGSRDLGISHFRYAPDYRAASGHVHAEQEEAYVVVGGSGRALLDGEVVPLRRWDVVRIATGVNRALAAGPDGLEIIAVGGPKPATKEAEMAPIEWPDA